MWLGSSSVFYCTHLSGALTLTIMNPFWVLKTRLCLQYERLASNAATELLTVTGASSTNQQLMRSSTNQLQRITTWASLLHLWHSEGLSGLYRGYLVGLVGVSHGALQFTAYEQLRNVYNRRYRNRPSNSKLVCASLLPVCVCVCT